MAIKTWARRLSITAAPVVAGGVIVACVVWLPSYVVGSDRGSRAPSSLSTADLLKAKNDVRTTLLQAVGGLILLAGAVATWRQLRLGREQQVTDRFTRAIDQLGSDKVDVSVGGIYALERITRDSKRDQGAVMAAVIAHIRARAPWPSTNETRGREGKRRPTLDVQAALTVLGRRDVVRDDQTLEIRLSDTDLRGASLRRGNFEKARFRRTQLEKARLEGANLRNAELRDASLIGADLGPDDELALPPADLEKAKLPKANLTAARLRGVNLAGARLQEAVLYGADLEGTVLAGANLQKAKLNGANLDGANLTGARLEGAVQGTWVDPREGAGRDKKRTTWPEGFDPVKAGVVDDGEPADAHLGNPASQAEEPPPSPAGR